MSPKLSDPVAFLTNLVTKKGRSERFGVYLTGVNVLADANENYGYDVSQYLIEREIESLFSHEKADWNQLLVDTRLDIHEIVHPISFIRGRDPNTVYFISEGNEMSAFVFIPTILVEEFATEVTFYQHLLREVAHFAGKTSASIRFTLGSVSMEWDELVDRGCAREVDVGF
jgi:hypothetical protein